MTEFWKRELAIREGADPNAPECRELRRRVERYADDGYGSCLLADPRVAALVRDNLFRFDGERYRLVAWCIMPNHVHALVEPLPGFALSQILHGWRSYTAHAANKLLGRTGAFWQAEYFDRFIRNADHLRDTIGYIADNPAKAGLKDWPWLGVGDAGSWGACYWGAGGPPAAPHGRAPAATAGEPPAPRQSAPAAPQDRAPASAAGEPPAPRQSAPAAPHGRAPASAAGEPPAPRQSASAAHGHSLLAGAVLLAAAAISQSSAAEVPLALFDDTPGAEASAPSSAVSAPFSEWDGVTQIFPRPGAASFPHAEFAESDSHAESAEFESHAESAESAEFDSHAESAENAEPGGASSPSEPGSPAGGAAERSEAEGVIQHSAFCILHSSLPSLSLVSEFPLPDSAPEGLSGIAWRGAEGVPGQDDLYALVEDSGGRLHAATIGIDRRTGAITNAVLSPAGAIPGAADLEGVAAGRVPCPGAPDGSLPMLFASDERGPAIRAKASFGTSGPDWAALPLPSPLRRCRFNLALEALALSADGRTLWTANEGPLPEDGPEPTPSTGATIRIFGLPVSGLLPVPNGSRPAPASSTRDPAASPTEPAFWFYELDPATGSSLPHLPEPFNGLAALCALPDGRLLALERSFGFRTRSPEDPRGSLITISIYLVDPLAAPPDGTDSPSEPGSPAGGAAERSKAEGVIQHSASSIQHSPPSPLAKALLWRGLTGRANYEGMTLGPELADGSRALILVSDGDVTRKGAFAFPWSRRLLALRLRLPAGPAPDGRPR